MKLFKSFFSAAGFKMIFLLLILLLYLVFEKFLDVENEVVILFSIFLLANLMVYFSLKVNGYYIISGVTNCLIGTVLYFFILYMSEIATARNIYVGDQLEKIIESVKMSIWICVPTIIIGFTIAFIEKRKKREQSL